MLSKSVKTRHIEIDQLRLRNIEQILLSKLVSDLSIVSSRRQLQSVHGIADIPDLNAIQTTHPA